MNFIWLKTIVGSLSSWLGFSLTVIKILVRFLHVYLWLANIAKECSEVTVPTHIPSRVRGCSTFSSGLANFVLPLFFVFTIRVSVTLSRHASVCLSLTIHIVGPHYVCLFICFDTLLVKWIQQCVCVWWCGLSLLLIGGNSLHILDIVARNLWTFLFCILQFPLLTVSSDKNQSVYVFEVQVILYFFLSWLVIFVPVIQTSGHTKERKLISYVFFLKLYWFTIFI